MNIISEVDYSRQVLEPKSIFSKAFRVSGNLLATSVHLLFVTSMALASESWGHRVEGGWGVTAGLRRTPTPNVWTQRPGQKKPERWASGQRGMYLPRSVFPAVQLIHSRRLYVGKGVLQGIVGLETTTEVAWEGYQLCHRKGRFDTWQLIPSIVLRK